MHRICHTPYDERMTYEDDRIDDLKDTIKTRFDDTNARLQILQNTLEGLETKDHAASEIKHLNYRVNDLEERFQASKNSLWVTVCTVASVVAFIVTTVIAVLNLLPH